MGWHDNLPPSTRMADICQTVVGHSLTWFEPPSAVVFEDLFVKVKSPTLEIERLGMETTLRRFADRLAGTIHANFHARLARSADCTFLVPTLIAKTNERDQLLVYESLAAWAKRLRADFLAAHDSAAQRARRLLDTSAENGVNELAQAVATGKRTLERHFVAEIDITIAEYRTRRRLERLVRQLHDQDGCVESAALIAGWASKRGMYDSLYNRTGLTPSDIRKLSKGDLDGLVSSLIICGRSALRCVRCSPDDRMICPRHHAIDQYPVHLLHELDSPTRQSNARVSSEHPARNTVHRE
jgi:AraC-like DNA-binding protein